MKKITIAAKPKVKLHKDILKRKTITKIVYTCDDSVLSNRSVDDVISVFQNLKLQHPEKDLRFVVDLDVDTGWYGDSCDATCSFKFVHEEQESDAEYDKRINQAEKDELKRLKAVAEHAAKEVQRQQDKENKKIERERKTFEKLKAKFEPAVIIDKPFTFKGGLSG